MYTRIEAFATPHKLGSKRQEQPPSTSVVLLGKKLMHMSTTTGHVLQENRVHNHLYHIPKGYWLHHNGEDLIALQHHSGRCWSSTAAPREEMRPTRVVLEPQSSCFLHSSTWNLHMPKEKFSLPSHSSNTNFSNIGEGSQDFMHCIVPSPANILQILHQLSCSCCQAKVYRTLSCICLFHNCAQPFVFVPFSLLTTLSRQVYILSSTTGLQQSCCCTLDTTDQCGWSKHTNLWAKIKSQQ